MQLKHMGLYPCLGDLVAKLPSASIRARVGSWSCAVLLRSVVWDRLAPLCKGAHFKELSTLCFFLASHFPVQEL